MILIRHEWKQHRVMFWIWSGVVLAMNLMIIAMYPDFADQAEKINDMFANMGTFTAAFGMNRLSIGSPLGFYGIEGGSMMGIGGGMLMALIGGSIVCKEESSHTAEFLFTAPQKRGMILLKKLATVVMFAIVFYVLCTVTALVGFKMIDADIDMSGFMLYHLAQFMCGLEIACICFGISAFLRRTNFGLAIGVAIGFYFLQVIANITDKAEGLKYITPYAYADASKVLVEGKIEWGPALVGGIYAVAAVTAGVLYFRKKDLRA